MLFYLLIHLLTYLYLIYNFYVFILINLAFLTVSCINDHIAENKMVDSKNLILKGFIKYNTTFGQTGNIAYNLDIRLSKFKVYETCKEFMRTLSMSCADTGILILSLYRQKMMSTIAFLMDSPTSQPASPINLMAQFLPMLLSQPSKKPVPKPIPKPVNPLLYDSDDDNIVTDLGVE